MRNCSGLVVCEDIYVLLLSSLYCVYTCIIILHSSQQVSGRGLSAIMDKKFTYSAVVAIALLVLAGLGTVVSAVFLVKFISLSRADLPPANQSATPVGNGFAVPLAQQLWPQGFDSRVVTSVNVSYSVRDGNELKGNVSFYGEECSKLRLDQVFLPPVPTTLRPLAYSRNPVNYLGGDYPLYVSGGNSSLKYVVNASGTISNESTGCALQLYLYNSSSEFSVFKDGLTPDAPYGEYVAKSDCLPVGRSGEPQTGVAIFNLGNVSLYYVGVAAYANVSISLDISGTVLEYNVSKLEAVDCSLSPEVKSCVVQISNQAQNACVLYESDNPFGVVTLFFDTQATPWNVWSVTCLVFLPLSFLLTVLVILSFAVYYCWWKRKKNGHEGMLYVAISEEESYKPGEQVVP